MSSATVSVVSGCDVGDRETNAEQHPQQRWWPDKGAWSPACQEIAPKKTTLNITPFCSSFSSPFRLLYALL